MQPFVVGVAQVLSLSFPEPVAFVLAPQHRPVEIALTRLLLI